MLAGAARDQGVSPKDLFEQWRKRPGRRTASRRENARSERDNWIVEQIDALTPIKLAQDNDKGEDADTLGEKWSRVDPLSFVCSSILSSIPNTRSKKVAELEKWTDEALYDWAEKMEPPSVHTAGLFAWRRRSSDEAAADMRGSGADSGKFDGAERDVNRLRHALFERSVVLFIWGLAPSLPALIHIEIGAILYNHRRAQRLAKLGRGDATDCPAAAVTAERIGDALEGWRALINWLNRYCLRSRAGVEHDLLQLLLLSARKAPSNSPDSGRAPTAAPHSPDREAASPPSSTGGVPFFALRYPDASIETLGVGGPFALLPALEDELENNKQKSIPLTKTIENAIVAVTDRPDIIDKLRKDPNRRQWQDSGGLFEDIETHLEAALKYCGSVEEKFKGIENELTDPPGDAS